MSNALDKKDIPWRNLDKTLANSELISRLNGSGSGASMSRSYEDHRDLLTVVSNVAGATMISRYEYQNDALGRRTQRIDASGAVVTNAFAYNPRSELTNAAMSANVFAYQYDNIGNRQQASQNSETKSYTANALNQYTGIEDGSSQTLTHDLDGNLTSDGTWTNTWDGENRLASVEPMSPTNGSRKVLFAYDYMGRRVSKVVSVTNSGWTVVSTNLFIYDGWNCIAEVQRPVTGEATTNYFTWGLDLSGSLQGAGGIGGLLLVSINGTNAIPAFDGNGNVMQLVNSDNGSVVASYEYSPFGELTGSSGQMAESNPFRFSTKYWDGETSGTYYYGYRDYSPELGRWMARDPAEERGGLGLYGFVGNNPITGFDLYGLVWEITRGNNPRANAVHPCGEANNVAQLADLIGLDGYDYMKWLQADDGLGMPSTQFEPILEKREFTIPNMVIAYWGGGWGGLGRWAVYWNSNVSYLRTLGFNVKEISGPSASWTLQSELRLQSQNAQLHGLYFWGHGGPVVMAGGPGIVYTPRVSTVLSDANRALPMLYGNYQLEYDQAGLEYRMALGFLYACETSVFKEQIFTDSAVFFGYSGTLIPVPWRAEYKIGNHLSHGTQGTR